MGCGSGPQSLPGRPRRCRGSVRHRQPARRRCGGFRGALHRVQQVLGCGGSDRGLRARDEECGERTSIAASVVTEAICRPGRASPCPAPTRPRPPRPTKQSRSRGPAIAAMMPSAKSTVPCIDLRRIWRPHRWRRRSAGGWMAFDTIRPSPSVTGLSMLSRIALESRSDARRAARVAAQHLRANRSDAIARRAEHRTDVPGGRR